MILIILGLVLGVVIGTLVPIGFGAISSLYISVALFAAIDSIIGAIRSSMENTFEAAIFISGFLLNTIIAMVLSFLGDKLGVPMYYAAIFVFGTRIFNNAGMIRRQLLLRLKEKRKKA